MNALAAIGYPLLVVAALNLGIGSFLATRGKQDHVARYAGMLGLVNAVYSWVMGMAYLRAAAGLPYDIYYRSAWVGWLAMAPVAQIILALQGNLPAARRWGRRLYLVWGGVLVLCLTTDVFEAGAVSLLPFIDRIGWLEQPARAAGALMLCWALVELYGVQRASKGRRRQQTAYFLLGLAIYVSAGVLFAGVVQLFGEVRFDPGLVSYFSIAWMAFTFYAITRHRLFDIRIVVSRVTLAVLLTMFLVALQVFLFRWITTLVDARTAIVLVSLLAGVVFFSLPLVVKLERGVEWLVVRRRYDYRRAMKESVRALASVGSVDDVLSQLVGSIRGTIASTSADVLLRDGDVFRRRGGYGPSSPPDELSATATLAQWLARNSTPFVTEEQQLALTSESFESLAQCLQAFGGQVAVAMRYRGEILGILIVGPKEDREGFVQSDLDLLETLANEAAIAVTNAQLVDDLQQAVRARDDFVSIAGHELRTPLTALRLSIHTALRMLPEDDPVGDRLRLAERQILRLGRLTDDLLDVSRITAGRMSLECESVELGALVREVGMRFFEEISRAGSRLDLIAETPVIGHWDRLRLEQVVSNLLSNAIKYGVGKPLAVLVERDQDCARLVVRDEGIGIEEADQRRIFDRFERAVTVHRVGGFGLGLWITKQIVDAHHGTIRVQSLPGVGSSFVVELPLQQSGSRS